MRKKYSINQAQIHWQSWPYYDLSIFRADLIVALSEIELLMPMRQILSQGFPYRGLKHRRRRQRRRRRRRRRQRQRQRRQVKMANGSKNVLRLNMQRGRSIPNGNTKKVAVVALSRQSRTWSLHVAVLQRAAKKRT